MIKEGHSESMQDNENMKKVFYNKNLYESGN